MALLRSLCRRASVPSFRYFAIFSNHLIDAPLRQKHSRSFFTLSNLSSSAHSARVFSACRFPFAMSIGNIRSFSNDVTHLPDIKDPEIKNVFKDIMAADWDELPEVLIHDVLKVLTNDTDDKAGKEALKDAFRAAEAAEEFIGILVSLKMELDDSVGLSGEEVKPLSGELKIALQTAYNHYTTYLDSFGPDEYYLRKKVETELGTRMIHLKIRCSGIGSEWGKVTLLGTSGLSGSYVEQRGP